MSNFFIFLDSRFRGNDKCKNEIVVIFGVVVEVGPRFVQLGSDHVL